MHISTETVGSALVTHVGGRLDFHFAPVFQKDLETLLQQCVQEGRGLLLNCLKLDYVSSAGLRSFLVGARAAQSAGVAFVVCNLASPVQEVFDVSGFSRLITTCGSQAAGLERIRLAAPGG